MPRSNGTASGMCFLSMRCNHSIKKRLGHCLEKNATYFGAADGGNRPGT